MKFTCHVDINQPIDKVVELFDNPNNMDKWQDGFQSFETISGEQGQPGAKSIVKYQMGKRKIELLETIEVRNLPHEFSGTYEHSHMTNEMKNFFEKLDENKTRWTAQINYTKLKGFMPKLMATLAPSMFKKQTQKWLDQFKEFAEKS